MGIEIAVIQAQVDIRGDCPFSVKPRELADYLGRASEREMAMNYGLHLAVKVYKLPIDCPVGVLMSLYLSGFCGEGHPGAERLAHISF